MEKVLIGDSIKDGFNFLYDITLEQRFIIEIR